MSAPFRRRRELRSHAFDIDGLCTRLMTMDVALTFTIPSDQNYVDLSYSALELYSSVIDI